jgi:predicted NBD/HSP70 family sugar kinase
MSDFGETSDRPRPRLAMLREITDRSVLDEVFRHRQVTRAELAIATGISKPTIWESVRRLEKAGLLCAMGNQATGRRGREATFYELAQSAGWVLALAVNQEGVQGRAADMAGCPFGEDQLPPVAPGDASALIRAIRRTVRRALGAGSGRGTLQAVALSVANPVHPGTREIIPLPGSPFPEGMLLPAEILAGLVEAPLLVDNDVNLAAMAERHSGAARDVASFAYIYIGAGLGLGLYIDDQLIRGAHGLAGEIGYLSASLRSDEHLTLAEAIARQGFGRSDAPSIDVAAVLDAIGAAEAGDPTAMGAIRQLGASIGHAIVATCAIVDPELVLLGGPIGSQPALLESARATVTRLSPGRVRIATGSAEGSAPLRGALHLALDHGRRRMLTSQSDMPERGEG